MLQIISLLACLLVAPNSFAGQSPNASILDMYVGTFPCAGKDRLFREPAVLQALKTALGNDWKAFEQHRAVSGCSAVDRYNNYLFVDVAQLHVGGYDSMILFNPENKQAYVFWLKGRVLDGDAVTYGQRPIPLDVLEKFQRELSIAWGHAASFLVQNGELVIVDKPSQPINP